MSSLYPWLCSLQAQIDQRFQLSGWPSSYLLPLTIELGGGDLAKVIVQRLLCAKQLGSVDCSCKHCVMVQSLDHPDLTVIRPDEDAAIPSIKIDDLRVAIDRISKAPTLARVQVIYIESSELMTNQCANALLKTLEEPKSRLHIVMQTNVKARLLPTIISRLFVETVRLDTTAMTEYANDCFSQSPQHAFLRYTHKHQPSVFAELVKDDSLVELYRSCLRILLNKTWLPLTQAARLESYSVVATVDALLYCLSAICLWDRGLVKQDALSGTLQMHAPENGRIRLSPVQFDGILDVCLAVKRKLASRISLNAMHLKSTLLIEIWRLQRI